MSTVRAKHRVSARFDPRLFGEVMTDVFAGWGGASLGMEMATKRPVAVCVNHCPRAIEFHGINHPHSEHVQTDVWEVDPRKLAKGRPVGLAWFSPDCRHFSRARGAAPVSKRVRSLAWVVVKWARERKPRVIMVENVREFLDWGPTRERAGAVGVLEPIPERKGETFRRWVSRLKADGYAVEWKVLDAADYGVPQHRRRLFVIARRDGEPIVWPTPTHGKGRKPFRTAAECIDWTIPVPSIFDRKRPLAEKTLRRVAMGIKRFVLENPRPFILATGQQGATGDRCTGTDEPLSTVVTKAEHCLVAPSLVTVGYGERDGQAPRCRGVDAPASTVVGGGKAALCTAFLSQFFGGMVGKPLDVPAPTLTGKGPHEALVAASMIRFNFGPERRLGVSEPLRTITSLGNKAGLVYAFLSKYFGQGIGCPVNEPSHTVTSKDRMALVTVTVDGVEYAIVDIGLRMLSPRELARCQGFPDDYVLPETKSLAVKLIGNSVAPPVVAALVKANVPEMCKKETLTGRRRAMVI